MSYLNKNAAAAGFNVYPEAVGVSDGRVSICDQGDSNLATVSAASDEQAGIQQVSLAKVVERLGGQIDLAKIDCEGAEWEMFTDKSPWAKISSVRMEYHLWGRHKYAEVQEAFLGLGFEIHHHVPSSEHGTIWARKMSQT